ncbi:MAG: hypothetical protein J5714_02170 [Alphaproteobacteria bacterium]|nr:hypothetical protein [Alphaproteobacteria bacterium]
MSDYEEYVPKYVGTGMYAVFVYKVVARVDENTNNFRLDFVNPDGGMPFVGQGMFLPKVLGFVPKKGMKVIYDMPDHYGADGAVSFYDDNGKRLFCAERRNLKWNAVHDKSVLPIKPMENGR